jgi:hypothetical protein
MWFRDFIWILYWRWYLDWPMIGGAAGVLLFITSVLNLLKRTAKIGQDTLTIFILPILLMGLNYLGMLAIDIAVTVFADTYINGTWVTETLYLFNMTAQRLYHGFFFWFMPMLLIVGLPSMLFLHRSRYLPTFRAFTVCMMMYAWSLGFLDPVVCQYIWHDWRIFGDWAMMGFDPMWAEGWIAHYVVLGCGWLVMNYLLVRIYRELPASASMSNL